MNVERIPLEVRDDIEDQSLGILERIAEDVVIVGGWAVRAVLGPDHGRFSLDVDAVAGPREMEKLIEMLDGMGFELSKRDWGIRMFAPYIPGVDVGDMDADVLDGVEMRVEVSGPRMFDIGMDHFFEFPLDEFETRSLPFQNVDGEVSVRVPSCERLAANKLGLPVDYKNNFDAAMLLVVADIDKVIEIILDTNDWRELLLRRGPKQMGRIRQSGRIERVLARDVGLDIDGYITNLRRIHEAIG